jgi:hypothetical protein
MHIHPMAAKWRRLSLSILASMMVLGYLVISPAPRASAAATTWNTFHDPLYGFSLSYPSNWQPATESNGSHLTLLNPATETTLSPLVTTQPGTPAAALQQDTPASAIGLHTRTVAGHQAVEYLAPYVPAAPMHDNDAASVPLQTRLVLLPVANTSGSTNLYTFRLDQPTDATGKISTAEQADAPTFDAIVDTFTLPAQVASVTSSSCPSIAGSSSSAVSPSCNSGCNRICWANDNWAYTDAYDLTDLYCTISDGYSGQYTNNASCGNGHNHYATTVPGDGWYQPNFECADFVSRALAQDGLVVGLNNGGVNGTTPVTQSAANWPNPNITYSFQYYPFTDPPYSRDTIDNQIYVPTFYSYLTSDSGIGVSLGTNTLSGNGYTAQPGDVVFFGRSHVMLLAAFANNIRDTSHALLDGHNASAYRNTLAAWQSNEGSYEVVHIRATYGVALSATLNASNGAVWQNFTDGYGQASSWVSTVSGRVTASVYFNDPTNSQQCAVIIYVPNGNATTNTPGLVMVNGQWVSQTVNESNIDGWAVLYRWGALSAPPTEIALNNNSGAGNQLGIGLTAYLIC